MTLAELDRWDPEAVHHVFEAAIARADGTRSGATGIGDVMTTVPGSGQTYDAAQSAAGRISGDLLSHAAECEAVGRAAETAEGEIRAIREDWRRIQRMADQWGLVIDLDTNEISYAAPADPKLAAEKARRFEVLHSEIEGLIARANTADADLAAAIRGAAGQATAEDINRRIDDHAHDPGLGRRPSDPVRRHNQVDAFRQVMGRDPVSGSDWESAAALDPHTYNAKNQGVKSNIVVARINPVPGQGVVRTNLFIPSHDVWDPAVTDPLNPIHSNLGDDRGFSPTAGPEDSRVSMYVDYDNGLIIARQNPSVDATTGQVRTGTPTISAIQQPNGSVFIRYAAADPFSPGGDGLAKTAGVSVNGTMAMQPTAAGVKVGGNITSFPAAEIYQDRPGVAPVPLLQSWPTLTDGQSGPGVGLWFHKGVGDFGVANSFNNVYPQMPLPAPPHAPTHPPVMLPAPPMVSAPPTTLTPLGPAADPPHVWVHDPFYVPPPPPPR